MRNIFFALLLVLAAPAYAATAPAPTFMAPEDVAKEQATIDRVQNYLTNLTTIIADFTQVAPDGTLTSGKFFLERPGKMRWQYNPPTPILMVADGKTMIFYDYELEQLNYIPLDSSLIGFLAQDPIRFDKQVGITEIEKKASVIRITVAQHDKPTEGSITLEFTDKPLLIRNMIIRDATNQVTSVSLTNARFGVQFDKKLFVFKDPRKLRTKL